MDNSYFCLDKKLEVLIYGVNYYSKRLVSIMQEWEINVLAFIDRRANELGAVDGIRVVSFNDAVLDSFDKNTVWVVVMLQNALQHDSIANELYQKGFKCIVYVPMGLGWNKQNAEEMIRVFNSMLLGDFNAVKKIPCYESIMDIEEENICNCIDDRLSEYVVARIPADLVYTNPQWITNKNNLIKYADAPLLTYIPYIQMMSYFVGGNQEGSLEEYLQDYGINSCNYSHSFTNEKIIVQRHLLYEAWNRQFQNGLSFFEASAPLAQWNENGYFNLMEGQHRTLFLVKKGIFYVPVRLKKSEWNKWKEVQPQDLYENISLIESMLYIQQNLQKQMYFHKCVFSFDEFDGYFGKHFRKMGAENVVIFSKKDVEDLVINNGYNRNISEFINRFSLVSIIGSKNSCSDLKTKLWEHFEELTIDVLVISLSDEEINNLEASIRERMVRISKIFMECEMSGIYFLKCN